MTDLSAAAGAAPRVALITGATGFVGSRLACRLLRDGWRVHVLTRAHSRAPDGPWLAGAARHVHDGSTEDLVRCMAEVKPDVVFHLASLFLSQHGAKDVQPLVSSNVLFSSQLLEAMHANRVGRIVNTGTSWQHYNNDDYNPVCLYAATKQAFDAILEYYVQACGIEAITLSLFDTYGADDPRPKLFHLLRQAAAGGAPLDMSAGQQLIDLVHIDDVTHAYALAAQRLLASAVTRHERYAVSSGQPLPLQELVRLYAEATRQQVAVNWGARPYREREVMRPWDSGQAVPGWRPNVGLRAGLSALGHGPGLPG